MSALGRVVRAGVGRRRVQTLVMTLTTLMAVTASVLALGLLVASRAPFDHAFATQKGAHLTGQFDGTKATAAQIAATADAPGVTAAAGPFRSVSLSLRTGSDAGEMSGITLPPLTVVGRKDAGGPVDDIDIVDGHWITGPGQIVLSSDYEGPPVEPGTRFQVMDLPGHPTLTLVGYARSVGHSADGWVSPAQVGALTAAGSAPQYQMLYRFASAATRAQVAAGRSAIVATVPAGALSGSQSYLTVKLQADGSTAAFVPFVLAFGVLGLVMSVLIVGTVVSGAVGAGRRRIGILKSLGFTPAQVARAYVGQALIPASLGTVLGVVLGNLLAVPLLAEASDAYNAGSLTVAPWVDVAVAAGALGVVLVTALVPALRAGRLRTAEAISVGRAAHATRGLGAQRLVGRLPLPRALSLGLAHPFARPARTATTAAAVVFGAVAVTFAFGLATTLQGIQEGINRGESGAVVVPTGAPGSGPVRIAAPGSSAPEPADPAAVAAAIKTQPATRAFYGTGRTKLSVAGMSGATTVVGYQGDESWATYPVISGRWLKGPGEAVVNTRFLQAAGIGVGDSITLTGGGHTTSVRIVGEVFNTHEEGMEVLTGLSTLTRAGFDVSVGEFHVDLRPGTGVGGYLKALNTALEPTGAEAFANDGGGNSTTIAMMDALIASLTLMLVTVAGLGVLNTVVLDTRERVHDLGVFKALGMAPRQTVAMVLTSVAGTGLVAGVIGVPAGVAVHRWIVPAMGHSIGTNMPPEVLAVYHLPVLVLLGLGGLVIAVAGALLPAGWAARTRTATALRTE